MEPGRRDREQMFVSAGVPLDDVPQWSPVDVTGNSWPAWRRPRSPPTAPQWSPVDVTGNSCDTSRPTSAPSRPQWSPVDVTGNSGDLGVDRVFGRGTSRNGARST